MLVLVCWASQHFTLMIEAISNRALIWVAVKNGTETVFNSHLLFVAICSLFWKPLMLSVFCVYMAGQLSYMAFASKKIFQQRGCTPLSLEMREEGGMRKGTSAWRQGSSRSSWQRAHSLHQDVSWAAWCLRARISIKTVIAVASSGVILYTCL